MVNTKYEALVKCDPNSILWRYIDLEKFELMLKDKALFLCRSDKFADPFEASIPRREAEYRIKEQVRLDNFFKRPISFEKAKEKSKEIGDLHKRFRKSFVVNCWHISTNESDAMWRLYLKTNEGVAIQSSYQKLHDSLMITAEEILLIRVRYLDYDKDIWYDETEYPLTGYNLFSPIVHKRIEFKHESELRVIQQINEAVDNAIYWDDKPNQMGKNVNCEIDTLIDKIILPPTAEKDVEEKVKELLKKYGINKEIIKSKLNEPPIY